MTDEVPFNAHAIAFAARGFVGSLTRDQRRSFRVLFGGGDTAAMEAAVEQVAFVDGKHVGHDAGGVLIPAVEYALPRSSTAPGWVSDEVTRRWPKLDIETRRTIRGKVAEAFEQGRVGMQQDQRLWQAIMKLPITAEETADLTRF